VDYAFCIKTADLEVRKTSEQVHVTGRKIVSMCIV